MNNIADIEKLLHSLKEEAVPSDAFKSNARIRILNTVTNPHPLRLSWYQRPRVLGYTFGTAIATVLLSVGTVYAAQTSLPNTPLYPVKVLSEDVALTLSPTESLKTTVAQTIISRRVTEVEDAQKQGNSKAVQESMTHLNEDVTSIQKRKDVSQNRIDEEISKHKEVIKTEHPDIIPSPTNTQTEIKLPSVEGVTTTHEDN